MKAILALGMLPLAALFAPHLALRPVSKKNPALRRKPFPGHKSRWRPMGSSRRK